MCVLVGESLHNAKIMWVGTGQFINNSYKNFGVGIAHPDPPIDLPLSHRGTCNVVRNEPPLTP